MSIHSIHSISRRLPAFLTGCSLPFPDVLSYCSSLSCGGDKHLRWPQSQLALCSITSWTLHSKRVMIVNGCNGLSDTAVNAQVSFPWRSSAMPLVLGGVTNYCCYTYNTLSLSLLYWHTQSCVFYRAPMFKNNDWNFSAGEGRIGLV